MEQRGHTQTRTAAHKATAASREQGTERANTGTPSMCGGATETVDPEGGPLFEGSRPLTAQKKVPPPGKCEGLSCAAEGPVLEDAGRSRHKKGSSTKKKVKV